MIATCRPGTYDYNSCQHLPQGHEAPQFRRKSCVHETVMSATFVEGIDGLPCRAPQANFLNSIYR